MKTLPAEHVRMVRSYAAESWTHMDHSNISNNDGGGK